MNYYSSETVTKPVEDIVKVTFETNPTHHIMHIPWEYANKETTSVEITNTPLKIVANSYDGISYHKLSFTLNLNYDVITLKESFFEITDDGVKVYIPKENMKFRKPETVRLPRK